MIITEDALIEAHLPVRPGWVNDQAAVGLPYIHERQSNCMGSIVAN
ncbi:MAG: hypothetical protein JXB15_13975 [Anaerolineales bacterium]|nr:hypothetical protein [Anaerolineales bacterium]